MEDIYISENESIDDLQLKGIKLIQKKENFRFGVDAVLLANYTVVRNGENVIDLCSGTGIVPFILVGKTNAKHITGIEIMDDMVEMANRSVKYNEMNDKIEFIQRDLKDVSFLKTLEKADIVTVNPPYKLKNSGLVNNNNKNAIARHEICCTLEDVIAAAKVLLKSNGKLFMIHRPERLADILCTMRKYKIEPKRIRMVHSNYEKPPSMVLIEGFNNGGVFLKWDIPLYIYNMDGEYSSEINKMYCRVTPNIK
jgi:tRNA1Val (adenine37-N6)-methyltransferase